ncbi:hypothetical protein [Methylobacterium haplocladii]|uniref:Uncharacterized protein n=1 Tax=Methylobacterium haplocladii TaxID=1176176 RepID=A0A512IJQ0_9HYPH|nr:hypothetical protein [Methylobacterium haplocladii]GEO97940.1 hypothetical protein MHA02_03280 [Methylobacterium haplocladii]GJD85987.1 hypothetical protein HPGCJGGD_3882 [Methylobacterium haplocladii]GLS58707.1 hypothetical protein GCM10007887_13710 [Methylobacterium haplocladii]
MTTAAAQARHLSLVRLEQAAGQAFGCADEGDRVAVRGPMLLTPTAITIATFATAVAATISYLV